MINIVQTIRNPLLLVFVSALLLQACAPAQEMNYVRSNQPFDLRDDDNDGVINARDICGNTPITSEIDVRGCSQWQTKQHTDDYILEFAMDKDQVLVEHEPIITTIVHTMADNPDARILLVGDTSPEGTDEYNRALGQRRADNVTTALVNAGVDPATIIGFVYTDALPQAVLQKRLRRTIVRVLHEEQASIDKWTIFTVENEHQEQAK